MTTLDDLRAGLAGAVLTAADPEWDDARLFHSGIGEPEVIVRPAGVDDVRAAVAHAARAGLPVTVRGGGHSAWGSVPGGLTIDLGALRDIAVDGTRVRVGGGATWGEVAAALAPRGLGISSGDTASVGVGGLTLGGGIGWMVRAWGLAADQLVGAQLVTSAGDVVEVSDDSAPELMWALRGGGGNFGVVTRFDFEAHRLPGVVWIELTLSGDARQTLRAMRDILRDAPRELTVTYMDVPPMDPSAPPGASLTACWLGDEQAARQLLAPVLSLPGVTEMAFQTVSYPEILGDMPPFDPERPAPGFVGGNSLMPELGDDTIDRLTAFREAQPASVLFLRSLGGAYGDVASDATAFAAREATWFVMAGAFEGPHVDDAERARVAADWAAIAREGVGVYGNFLNSTDPALAATLYPATTMARLERVKRAWDPENVFRRNHNVRPA
ncbi:FAD-binding oxidoreductase [Microbacterium sp. Marseille-Q6965]|uniref:FAD-binding oxidoreductase n=1 Tax=Microbacterium sp. Marseille-Q6965 TaxID=2965072 RepID=UPI0021B82BE5|nr:FAD-binding oxidoreductase [Microbacterium sp. Marseille-Q6965]